MRYYPLFLDMAGRPCIVIGGGPVAERKAEGLLHVQADVTIVGPNLTELLVSLVMQKKIRHIAREYRKGDLAGFVLAFAATDDSEVNAAVCGDARDLGIWVNVADDPSHCDFILPALLRRGELMVAVSSGGSSPALARAIREELEGYFTEDYATLAEVVGEVRGELKSRFLSPGAEAWRRALNGELRALIRDGSREKARNYLLKQLGVDA